MAKAMLSPADRRSANKKKNLAGKEPKQEVRLPQKASEFEARNRGK